MLIKIIAIIIALLMSDIYIILFSKILPIYTKRQNVSRKRLEENTGDEFPDIEYGKSFINRGKGIIIVCVILGVVISMFIIEEPTFLNLLRSHIVWGIACISICATIQIIVGKIKRIYYGIKYKDPYYYLIKKR